MFAEIVFAAQLFAEARENFLVHRTDGGEQSIGSFERLLIAW
jgi:hypothetical protein